MLGIEVVVDPAVAVEIDVSYAVLILNMRMSGENGSGFVVNVPGIKRII